MCAIPVATFFLDFFLALPLLSPEAAAGAEAPPGAGGMVVFDCDMIGFPRRIQTRDGGCPDARLCRPCRRLARRAADEPFAGSLSRPCVGMSPLPVDG